MSFLENPLILLNPISFNKQQKRMFGKMNETEAQRRCESGLKGSCLTCEFVAFCDGLWSRGSSEGVCVETGLTN
jgi:hypothetical protein